jgi:hypothetical protein
MTYHGECFCGAVQIHVAGYPAAMGYCHCNSCRAWSAAPVNAFSLWPADAVRVATGAEQLATYSKTPFSERQFCGRCGGHVMNRHSSIGLVDVYAAIIPSLSFTPALHVNYAETVLPMHDGLPKFRDFPADIGGSGEMVPE